MGAGGGGVGHSCIRSLDIWQEAGGAPPSFHILLHRFCANVIAETCKSPALIDLMTYTATHATATAAVSVHAAYSAPLGDMGVATDDEAALRAAYASAQSAESATFCHDFGLGLIELPLSVLILAAQVHKNITMHKIWIQSRDVRSEC